MLAAIITPAANPRKIRWTVGSGRLRKKNTVAAPRAVSRAVNPVPPAAHNSACANVLFLSRRGSRAAVIGGERTDGSPASHYAGGVSRCSSRENEKLCRTPYAKEENYIRIGMNH